MWLWEALRRVKNKEEREARYIAAAAPASDALAAAYNENGDNGRDDEGHRDPPVDEVTLVDARIFPAVQTQGTQAGGHTLPVARIPFSAIDIWWIISGETIKGQGRPGFGFGFLFPVPIGN